MLGPDLGNEQEHQEGIADTVPIPYHKLLNFWISDQGTIAPRFTAGISFIVNRYCTVHPVLGTAPPAISTGIRDICAFSLRKIGRMHAQYMYHIPLGHP